MVRGRVGLAWRAQPFGVLLGVLLVVFGALGAAELATGRGSIDRLRPRLWWAWALPAALLAGWAVKMLTGYFRGEYPLK